MQPRKIRQASGLLVMIKAPVSEHPDTARLRTRFLYANAPNTGIIYPIFAISNRAAGALCAGKQTNVNGRAILQLHRLQPNDGRLKKMPYAEENTARLKDMMITPPLSAAQHAVIMRKKTGQRRSAEDARDVG